MSAFPKILFLFILEEKPRVNWCSKKDLSKRRHYATSVDQFLILNLARDLIKARVRHIGENLQVLLHFENFHLAYLRSI